jgi:hypothetical protein
MYARGEEARGAGVAKERGMSKLVTLKVAHNLGKAEAQRRLQAGIDQARRALGSTVAFEEEVWQGDRLDFRVRAMGQAVSGKLAVEHDHVEAEFSLPAALAFFANRIKGVVEQQGTVLLEKK